MALTLWQPSFGDDGMCTGPPPTGSASTGSCGNPDAADETPPQDNLYNGAAQLLDISVPLQTGTPLWSEPAGLSSGFKVGFLRDQSQIISPFLTFHHFSAVASQ
jgi:hypothetical protein